MTIMDDAKARLLALIRDEAGRANYAFVKLALNSLAKAIHEHAKGDAEAHRLFEQAARTGAATDSRFNDLRRRLGEKLSENQRVEIGRELAVLEPRRQLSKDESEIYGKALARVEQDLLGLERHS